MSDEPTFGLGGAKPGDVVEVICGRHIYYIIITQGSSVREGWVTLLAITTTNPMADIFPPAANRVPAVLKIGEPLLIADILETHQHARITGIRYRGESIRSPHFSDVLH